MSTTKAYFKIAETVAVPDNTLVLVGTALDGPSYIPFRPSQTQPIRALIGDCPLATAYIAASSAGLSNIILYRINGQYATGSLVFGGTQTVMNFTSVSAGTDYNNIMIDFGPDKAVVTAIDGTQRTYFFKDYPSSGLMAEAMNLDSEYGLIEFSVQVVDPAFDMTMFDVDNLYTVTFSGGDVESTLIPNRTQDISSVLPVLEDRLKVALFGDDPDDQVAYEPNSALGLMDFGVISLVDMFHDDNASFTDLLAQFCNNKGILNGGGTVGVIGTAPIFPDSTGVISDSALSDKVTALLGKSYTVTVSSAGATNTATDPHAYVQIVVGDTKITSVSKEVVAPTSLAYWYAATQALLPYQMSMTNKTLSGVPALNYEFAKKDVEQLLANGYISIVSSVRKGFVPYSSVTAIGKRDSAMSSPTVVRISQALTKSVVGYLDSFVGSTESPVKRRALESGVKQVVARFVKNQVIRSADATFSYSTADGQAYVNISFTPFSYIGSVTSTVQMPFDSGVIS